MRLWSCAGVRRESFTKVAVPCLEILRSGRLMSRLTTRTICPRLGSQHPHSWRKRALGPAGCQLAAACWRTSPRLGRRPVRGAPHRGHTLWTGRGPGLTRIAATALAHPPHEPVFPVAEGVESHMASPMSTARDLAAIGVEARTICPGHHRHPHPRIRGRQRGVQGQAGRAGRLPQRSASPTLHAESKPAPATSRRTRALQ